MACYHPFAGVRDRSAGLTDNGKPIYKISGSWCPDLKYALGEPDVIKIPCGKCLGCRLDYCRQWADRMILELDHTGKGIFVTLTYDQKHVPMVMEYNEDGIEEFKGFTLDKRDSQLFFKRLRKFYDDRELRFYACGEYGKNTRRPHMHAVIFGLSLEDFFDLEERGTNELGQKYYTSRTFTGIWKNGFTMLSEVSYKTCAYVARYTMKKAFASDLEDYQEDEFALMSRMPGLGKYYYDDHPELFYSNDPYEWLEKKIYIGDENGSVKVSIPKYFYERLAIDDPDTADIIKEQRKRLASDAELLKLKNTDLSYEDQLEVDEEAKYEKVKVLNTLRESGDFDMT